MKPFRKIVYFLIVLCFTTALAQDGTCSAIIQQAMAQVQNGCALTGRNQACYGYVSLDATPREGVQDFTFAKAGDLASVGDLDTLRLGALDPANNTWGVALMKLQANLPDALPGQNVTFLLFGDVEIQNAATGDIQQATVALTSTANANLRNSPSTNGAVIGSLGKGDALIANGRNADSTWLRIQIPDSSALGWVFSTLVTPDGDVSALSIVDSTEAEVPFKPMQAFYFKTGITQTSCAEAPQDGIVIQTPQGAGQISLRANDVDIQLGSTAFLQATPNDKMTISVVEGTGHVTVGGKTVVVPSGSQVEIPVDANVKPTGAVSDPQPYDPALVQPLPVQNLPLKITVAPPASEAQIEAANHPPTPTPRPAASGGVSVIPGVLGNVSSYAGMSQAQFCAAMAPVFAQMGMTPARYVASIRPSLALVPASQRGDLDHFLAMIEGCE
ncbi:MAG: SH3 domain-containing protein [Chloroflexota bacterium]